MERNISLKEFTEFLMKELFRRDYSLIVSSVGTRHCGEDNYVILFCTKEDGSEERIEIPYVLKRKELLKVMYRLTDTDNLYKYVVLEDHLTTEEVREIVEKSTGKRFIKVEEMYLPISQDDDHDNSIYISTFDKK